MHCEAEVQDGMVVWLRLRAGLAAITPFQKAPASEPSEAPAPWGRFGRCQSGL